MYDPTLSLFFWREVAGWEGCGPPWERHLERDFAIENIGVQR